MFFEYANIKMYYEVIGEGKPVIMLHGSGCNMDMMKGCMESIFDTFPHYKRIYIDLPGMGKSGAELAFATADKMLEILIAFVKSITNENILLVGESYGGYLARGILSSLGDSVDGMMLLCPVIIPERGKRQLPESNIKFADVDYLQTLDIEEKNNFCEYAVLANAQTHQRYKEEILGGLKLANEDFLNQLEQYYAFTFDVDNAIKDNPFEKPTLFICGRQDECVGYKDLWNLLEDYPRATSAVIDVAGHNLQIEQPELFHSLVCNWLVRVEKY